LLIVDLSVGLRGDESLASRAVEFTLELGDEGFQFIQSVIQFQDQLVAFRHGLGKFSRSSRHRLSSHPCEPTPKNQPATY
jgi:hypothetical protein